MYLLLGHYQDPLCSTVHAALAARGLATRIGGNPLAHPIRLPSRVESDRCVSPRHAPRWRTA